ncbi:hypothetical protein [Psychrobacter pygoscelis]|uniref:hypothetical protein n=1 Tax=Psychrobacter pygoscelis TaxID=2488563 RepID=UPI00103C0F7C|nr:hypothetical protein [Psychrobacter pygoscelis]
MSIFIQVGHRSSYSKVLMEKMYERGLSQPVNSYTHQLTCDQVTETLDKVLSKGSESGANHKLADNIIVDLLLANLDLENWGWESEKNLSALSYWKQIEVQANFILIFDHPKYVLQNIKSASLSDIVSIMEEWTQYHQDLLTFYEDNEDCLLVEGIGAFKYFSKLKDNLIEREPTLLLKSGWQIPTTSTSLELDDILDPLLKLIIEELLKYFPKAIQVYNKLLEKSFIKSSNPIYKSKKPLLEDLVTSLISVHSNKNTIVEELNTIKEDNINLNNKINELSKNLNQQIDINEQIKNELLSKKSEIVEIEKELSSKSTQKSNDVILEQENIDLKHENEIVIKQMHQLQEELERYYIGDKNLEDKKNDELNSLDSAQSEVRKYYGAAERVKQDLPYRLGSTIVKHSKSPEKLVKLPFELAKEYYLFFNNNSKNLPELDEYTDVYEAEKIKNHLSYRLGKILVDSMQSPTELLTMPFKLSRESINFKRKQFKIRA